MNRTSFALPLVALFWAASFNVARAEAPRAQDANAKLAQQAYGVLEKYCYRCHGQNGANEGGFGYALDFAKLREKKIKAGNPNGSRLYKRAADDMPPEGPRPAEAELKILEQWIAGGAPDVPVAPTVKARPFVSTDEVFTALLAYLNKVPREDRRYIRFFSLVNLHNNPTVPTPALPGYRAALSKLLNSLSWKKDIVLPVPIDPNEVLFAIDLRSLDWERHNLWSYVVKLYPYGLKYDRYPDLRPLNDKATEVYYWTGTDLPMLRADWFIATAGRPPLYHTLLFDEVLPELRRRRRDPKDLANPKKMTAYDLEYFLGVDFKRNFLQGQLARAGFKRSGVSEQNRLLERHDAIFGSYWKSYDFKQATERNDIVRFPLGPVFSWNPYNRLAYTQDGGEIIFNLPNGLQGYMLLNGKDVRIDEGPIEVVSDSKKTSGTNVIVNGLSCMACHDRGMKGEFVDQVGPAVGVQGDARDLVRRLHPPKAVMDRLVQKDEARFLIAADQATGRFLRGPDAAREDITKFGEPIGPIAGVYLRQDVDALTAAIELGIPDPKELILFIRANDKLMRLGLGVLATGATIKRAEWERLEGTSLFQDTASVMRLGVPLR
jgi:serine/threonine-protein kinase